MLNIRPYTSLTEFLIAVIIVTFIYYGMVILRKLTLSTFLSEGDQESIRKVINNFILIYEPLAVLVLISYLIGIYPAFIGTIVLILLLISHTHWRNYISRTVILLGGKIGNQNFIHAGDVSGRISHIGKTNIHVQTEEGIHVMTFKSLLDNGYTISEGNRVGRIYNLHLIATEDNEQKNHEIYLEDQLARSPYIDWSIPPEIEASGIEEGNILLKLMLRDKSHLDEIVSLANSWGYTVR